MKVIFLDFDGVITVPSTRWHLSLTHMKRVGKILKATGAKIVVSSSWRHGGFEKFMEDIQNPDYFLCRPLPHNKDIGTFLYPEEIIGITPTIYPEPSHKEPGVDRGYEIDAWLQKYPVVDSYVILDDDSDFLESQKPLHIKTNYTEGLTDEQVEKAIDLLLDNGKRNNKGDTGPRRRIRVTHRHTARD